MRILFARSSAAVASMDSASALSSLCRTSKNTWAPFRSRHRVPPYWQTRLLFHERKHPDGRRSLVCVIGGFCLAPSSSQQANLRAYLIADTIQPATFFNNARAARQSRLDLPAVPRVRKGQTFYTLFAAHPDPSDKTCFTVAYQTPLSAGTAIGRLMPDDSVVWCLK
jgi:hypothetical protein